MTSYGSGENGQDSPKFESEKRADGGLKELA
jgi:hypothetical protein